jgi:uncharacterized membrane protein YbhN (UPF0104 family)
MFEYVCQLDSCLVAYRASTAYTPSLMGAVCFFTH